MKEGWEEGRHITNNKLLRDGIYVDLFNFSKLLFIVFNSFNFNLIVSKLNKNLS